MQGVHGPFLVVVPLSTVPNWIREFRKWLPQLNSVVYVGDTKSREVIVMINTRQKMQTSWSGLPTAQAVLIQHSSLAFAVFCAIPNSLPSMPVGPLRLHDPTRLVQVIRHFEFTPAYGSLRSHKFEALITTYELVLKDAEVSLDPSWCDLLAVS
jgi:SNF2 family DNA or RNA helicase